MFGVAMAMNGLGVLLTPMPYSLWFALGVVIGLVGLKVEAGLRS
jgi:hypothetical protein